MAKHHVAGQADAFAEIKPTMDRGSALVEANRCLYCYDAPCMRACPTRIDVPGFIKKIVSGNMQGSARLILEANILGASCARVCPTEELCEGACVLHDLHEEPIQIGRLQRYATDHVVYEDKRAIFEAGKRNGKRVAMIGAGPASLGCAAELSQLGYEVVCYDKGEKPGGLNSYGIADYKMSHEAAIKEIEWVEQLGVEIRCGVTIGEDISVEKLLADYDAVFLGVGLGAVPPIGMQGEELKGSRDALEFIAELKVEDKDKLSLEGKRVAVIGGGNTSIDAVTQAARLGAERVNLLYRRDRAAMGAYDHEQELALQDGGVFVLQTQPVEILGRDGHVVGIKCVKTRASEDGSLEYIEGSEHVIDCDLVLRATGQARLKGFLNTIEGLDLDGRGRVVIDEEGRTSHERIWSGGDCVSGGQEVVNAVAEGKAAARSIDRVLQQAAQGE